MTHRYPSEISDSELDRIIDAHLAAMAAMSEEERAQWAKFDAGDIQIPAEEESK